LKTQPMHFKRSYHWSRINPILFRTEVFHVSHYRQRISHRRRCHHRVLARKRTYNEATVARIGNCLDSVDHDPRFLECHDRILCWECLWYFPGTDQHACNRRRRHSLQLDPKGSKAGAAACEFPNAAGDKSIRTHFCVSPRKREMP